MKVKIVNKSGNKLPEYSTSKSSGMDLRAMLKENLIIKPFERAIVPTGLFIELPDGYEAQIRPRSGLAADKGITVLNSPGTIDCDYRGEIKVILINLSNEEFALKNGERIAQMVISKYEKIKLIETEYVNNTKRGSGGFGHTGRE